MKHESAIMNYVTSSTLSRRSLLISATAFVLVGATVTHAGTLAGGLPWEPGTASAASACASGTLDVFHLG